MSICNINCDIDKHIEEFKVKILLINGANLNMLGIREPDKYGGKSLEEIECAVIAKGKELGADVDVYQSNIEGEIVEKIQQARGVYDGILINAGGSLYYLK